MSIAANGQLDQTGACFEPTRWTLVDALRNGNGAARQRAMDALVRLYWPAVYGFLRRSGRSRDAAAEATQSFFTEVVLRRGLFERAEAARGRLRTLILQALKNHMIDRHRADSAEARASAWGVDVAALDAEEAVHPCRQESASEPPELFFERRCAVARLEEVMRRCEQHFRATGKAGHWELFESRVVHPSVSMVEPRPLAEIAAAHGFRSAADAAAAVQVVKKRMLAILEELGEG